MYVYFQIKDLNDDPAQITKILGVQPTKTYRKGDVIENTILKKKSSGWEFRVDAEENLDLEVLINKILNIFVDKERLKDAIRLGKAHLNCVLYVKDNEPTLQLSSEVIKKISELDCSLWIDYYPMASQES